MKQLLILSGKGGTGKTTIASSFIALSNAKTYADCDVDAPNLHLIRGKEYGIKEEHVQNTEEVKEQKDATYKTAPYYAMPKAFIDESKCVKCGKCKEVCRFNAIDKIDGQYKVNVFACEGCDVCSLVCKTGAIKRVDDIAGDLMLYEKKDEVFSTAKLRIGSGTSGKLVAAVKKQMIDARKKNEVPDTQLAIVDGSPGIGCPVISSLSGVDMVLLVAEPSMSGMSDMSRILKTAGVFGVKVAVCVNKFNTNTVRTSKIEEFCNKNHIPFVGKIPFDNQAVKAVNMGKSVVETECEASKAIKEVFDKTMKLLF